MLFVQSVERRYEHCAPPNTFVGRVAGVRVGNNDGNMLKTAGLYGFISSFGEPSSNTPWIDRGADKSPTSIDRLDIYSTALPDNIRLTMYKTDDFTGPFVTATGPGTFSFVPSACTPNTALADPSWNDQVRKTG
jgi:hypothetical protein